MCLASLPCKRGYQPTGLINPAGLLVALQVAEELLNPSLSQVVSVPAVVLQVEEQPFVQLLNLLQRQHHPWKPFPASLLDQLRLCQSQSHLRSRRNCLSQRQLRLLVAVFVFDQIAVFSVLRKLRLTAKRSCM